MEDPRSVNGLLIALAGISGLIMLGFSVYLWDFSLLLVWAACWGLVLLGCLCISALYVPVFGPLLRLAASLVARKPKGKHTANSFTLLELLIVVAIIGLLAGLLFPVLTKSREKAWQSRCLSNLHQLGLAVNLYAQDNHHYLPVAAMQPTVNTNLPAIASLLAVHVGPQSGVFQCPADRKPLDNGMTFHEAEGCSYSWNSLLNGRLIDRTQIDIASIQLWPPIMGDYEKFHGGSDSGRNYLYPDGRVEQDLKALIQ
jgi:prepilin-type N-terminal cleavage/methylation domain-containing protein